jgi:hypothetical protein
MPDVVESSKWNVAVSTLKEAADQLGACFDYKRFPNGKEKIVVELWYTPQKEKKNE